MPARTDGRCRQRARPAHPGWQQRHVSVGGREREYEVYVPERYAAGADAFPVVVGAPDARQSAADFARMAGLAAAAERYAYVAVALQGLADGLNVELNCTASASGPDDVAYVAAILSRLEAELCVDRARVHVTGYARGARFASRLASELSTRIASIAPVAGVRYPVPNHSPRPVPVLAIHGLADASSPFDGGGHYNWQSGVHNAMEHWARFNGCQAAERTAYPLAELSAPARPMPELRGVAPPSGAPRAHALVGPDEQHAHAHTPLARARALHAAQAAAAADDLGDGGEGAAGSLAALDWTPSHPGAAHRAQHPHLHPSRRRLVHVAAHARHGAHGGPDAAAAGGADGAEPGGGLAAGWGDGADSGLPPITLEAWHGCLHGADVSLYAVRDLGHGWPLSLGDGAGGAGALAAADGGGGAPHTPYDEAAEAPVAQTWPDELDTSALIFNFFEAHPLGGADGDSSAGVRVGASASGVGGGIGALSGGFADVLAGGSGSALAVLGVLLCCCMGATLACALRQRRRWSGASSGGGGGKKGAKSEAGKPSKHGRASRRGSEPSTPTSQAKPRPTPTLCATSRTAARPSEYAQLVEEEDADERGADRLIQSSPARGAGAGDADLEQGSGYVERAAPPRPREGGGSAAAAAPGRGGSASESLRAGASAARAERHALGASKPALSPTPPAAPRSPIYYQRAQAEQGSPLERRARTAIQAARAAGALRASPAASARLPSPSARPAPLAGSASALASPRHAPAGPSSPSPPRSADKAPALAGWQRQSAGGTPPSEGAQLRSAREPAPAAPTPQSAVQERLRQLRAERTEAMRLAHVPPRADTEPALGYVAGPSRAEDGGTYDFEAALGALRAASALNRSRAARTMAQLGGQPVSRAVPTERDYQLARDAVRAARLARQSQSPAARPQ